MRPFAPFPFLILQGPPASGKTLMARFLRTLLDPSASPLTLIPASAHDLVIAARQNWVLAFDHISALSPTFTEALCRISGGLGAALRESPGREPEPLLEYFRRPVILTATERWTCPPDLAERALIVRLEPLPPEKRLPESHLLNTFQQAYPAILGALCSAVSTGLQRLPLIEPAAGRLPDALTLALAAGPALDATEAEIYRAFAPEPAPHPVVDAVRRLLRDTPRWSGTASDLLDLLGPLPSSQNPRALSQQLHKCAFHLNRSGIALKFHRLHGGVRMIRLTQNPGDANSPKDVSPEPVSERQPIENKEPIAA